MLFSYFRDLMEKSKLIKRRKSKFPFDLRSHKRVDVTLKFGKLLKSLTWKVQKVFNYLLSNKTTTEMLGNFQRYLQNVFQEMEKWMA